MTALLAELPDAMVPEAPYRHPDLHPADANPRAQPASDASDGAHPGEAADVELPELADGPCVEKSADPELGVPALDAKHSARLPEVAAALCTPVAGPSAA